MDLERYSSYIDKIRELPREIMPVNEYKNFHIALGFPLPSPFSPATLPMGERRILVRLELIPIGGRVFGCIAVRRV